MSSTVLELLAIALIISIPIRLAIARAFKLGRRGRIIATLANAVIYTLVAIAFSLLDSHPGSGGLGALVVVAVVLVAVEWWLMSQVLGDVPGGFALTAALEGASAAGIVVVALVYWMIWERFLSPY